jgi:putative ABC transport system substrate-binding protein
VKRREFISMIGAALAAAPRVARGQQGAMPVIGVLRSTASDDGTNFIEIFRQGLKEAGYAEGKNVAIDFRSADNVYDRLPGIVAELARNQVAVIVASGAVNAALAAKAATKTIPIVFIIGSDPVEHGLVASLGRPGGNVTGVTLSSSLILAKRLELLHELVPDARAVGLLINPGNPNAAVETREIQKAAETWNWSIHPVAAGTASDLDIAVATMVRAGVGGFLHSTDLFFTSRYPQLVALAARHKLAAVYGRRDGPAAGGLASYGAKVSDTYRLGGVYAGRILQGAKPADLPVLQPTQFELAINLKSAKALGISVPTSVLLRADEVIE